MAAQRLPGILPAMRQEEALEASSIHSVAGLLPPGHGLLRVRPFRSPHHSISEMGLVGGGTLPRPGEISLAHHGVLFLDEVPEFGRRILELLRQPLEEGRIAIARLARTAVFPTRFVLVGAMNPCPCGYHGDATHTCRCTPLQVDRYRNRLSGPLRDRIDLTVEVAAVPTRALREDPTGESSATIRARVVAARDRQRVRLASLGLRVNADLTPAAIGRHCRLASDGARLLDAAAGRLALSARSHTRVLKVARTIADLDGAETIAADHLAEALQFRAPV